MDSQSDRDEESPISERPLKVAGVANNQLRPQVESLSESDDLTGRNAQKGRTQRRKKKGERPTLNRMDSLSESEEVQKQRGKGRGDGGMLKNGRKEKKDAGLSSGRT